MIRHCSISAPYYLFLGLVSEIGAFYRPLRLRCHTTLEPPGSTCHSSVHSTSTTPKVLPIDWQKNPLEYGIFVNCTSFCGLLPVEWWQVKPFCWFLRATSHVPDVKRHHDPDYCICSILAEFAPEIGFGTASKTVVICPTSSATGSSTS